MSLASPFCLLFLSLYKIVYFTASKVYYGAVLLSAGLDFLLCCCCCLVAKSCLILCNPMDHSPLGPSVHGISQARILEWVAISFSREASQPRDRTWVSHLAGRRCNLWATREATKRNKASPFPMAKAIGQYENRKMKMYDCKDHTLGNHTSLWANSE